MPRTKGSKNRVTASTDFDAQIAKLQKDKAMLEEGLSKTIAHIEELKKDIKSQRESLKPQKAEIKQTENEIAKLATDYIQPMNDHFTEMLNGINTQVNSNRQEMRDMAAWLK